MTVDRKLRADWIKSDPDTLEFKPSPKKVSKAIPMPIVEMLRVFTKRNAAVIRSKSPIKSST